jgi:hypothetical protein
MLPAHDKSDGEERICISVTAESMKRTFIEFGDNGLSDCKTVVCKKTRENGAVLGVLYG